MVIIIKLSSCLILLMKKCLEQLSDLYNFGEKLGSGSFGEVYKIEKIKSPKKCKYMAAKIEIAGKQSRIENEYRMYKRIAKYAKEDKLRDADCNLPIIYDYLKLDNANMMTMELLGDSLEDIFVKHNKRFKLQTVFKLADQMLTLIEQVHKCHILHRDIKPANFLVGNKDNKNEKTLYIMDFGLSRKWKRRDGSHIPFKDNKSLVGTARYASTNIHLGIEPSRRDDLESIGYILVYFLKGSLPWQGLKRKKGGDHMKAIGETKICTGINHLCKGLPSCFAKYLTHIRKKLYFDDTPNYKELRGLFSKSAKELGIKPKYEWL